jgi:hypothetical protein
MAEEVRLSSVFGKSVSLVHRTVNTDFFQERWEYFPDAKPFREFTQDIC